MIWFRGISGLMVENVLFFLIATAFLGIVGLAWKDLKPFELPQPLPEWFKYWFGTVQVVGGLLPILACFWWGVGQGYASIWSVWLPYLIMLGLQIASEILTLRKFHSVVWVMVPYLYLPYRFWQLYEGFYNLGTEPELTPVRYLLIANLILWIGNYLLDLSQLPRLFRWYKI